MGYSEVYCLACGGPCTLDNLEDQYENEDDRNERTRIKKIKNVLRAQKLDWILDWVVVREDGVLSGKIDTDFGRFLNESTAKWIEEENPERKIPSEIIEVYGPNAFGFHQKCWEIIGKPKFTELQAMQLSRFVYNNHVNTISYAYHPFTGEQDFPYDELSAAQAKLLNDPTIDEVSRENIIDSWTRVQKCRKK